MSQKTVWISITLLFWASFIPYITSLLVDWSQKRTIQGAYGLVVILTTAHLYWLYTSLNKDNAGSGFRTADHYHHRPRRCDKLL
ncbi:MAG: hypothetical protein ACI4CX_07855 [Candidatus Weimeria sp.]